MERLIQVEESKNRVKAVLKSSDEEMDWVWFIEYGIDTKQVSLVNE